MRATHQNGNARLIPGITEPKNPRHCQLSQAGEGSTENTLPRGVSPEGGVFSVLPKPACGNILIVDGIKQIFFCKFVDGIVCF